MKRVHCDGCTYTEEVGTPKSERRMEEVVLKIVLDKRQPPVEETYTADLCPACRALLLHSYFNEKHESLELGVPSFLQPEPTIYT